MAFSNPPFRTGICMRTQVDRSSHLLMRIPSLAAIFCCAVAIAASMVWMPSAMNDANAYTAYTQSPPMPAQSAGANGDGAAADVVSDSAARTTCAECGVIESVREIDTRGERAAESTRSYEVTVRFQDGSRDVFSEATPRTWRSGTRVMIVR